MPKTFDAAKAARYIVDAHRTRAPYENLPADIAPSTVDEAYAAQEALIPLWTPAFGPVAGLKIATTTKVMQQLMGIDHPCGGVIYAKRVHASPVTLRRDDFMNLMVECELAVRLARPLPKADKPYTAATARAAVGQFMPAFELIEDRKAHYKSTRALSLIADNAWNAGIVLGAAIDAAKMGEVDGIQGTLTVNGASPREGKTDDPMGALAWIANLAVERGRPLAAGMVVITGSMIATLPIAAGETFVFEIAGIGKVEMTAT